MGSFLLEVEVRNGAPYNFYNYAPILQENFFLNIKIHFIVDGVGYLFIF